MTFGDPKVMVLWDLEKSCKTWPGFTCVRLTEPPPQSGEQNPFLFLALEMVKVALPMVCIVLSCVILNLLCMASHCCALNPVG